MQSTYSTVAAAEENRRLITCACVCACASKCVCVCVYVCVCVCLGWVHALSDEAGIAVATTPSPPQQGKRVA